MIRFKQILISCLIFPVALACSSNDNNKYKTDLPSVAAHSAYDFYHSIGVCTHVGYANTAYNDFDGIVYPRLTELGVKYIRDGYSGRMSQDEQDNRYERLGKAGIKLLFVTGNDDPNLLLPKIKKLQPYLWGVEGSNEVDFSHNKDPELWVSWAINRQQALYDVIKNDPETKSLPVVNFSLAELGAVASLVGNQTNKIDYGNMHIYAAAKHPANHWGNGLSGEEALNSAKIVSGSKPIIMTECGYHNYVAYPANHIGAPEELAAIYLLHLYFEYFNQGIECSYVYELLNEEIIGSGEDRPIERNFGIVRADGSPKPAFSALKNLITLISDNQQTTPSPLDFELKAGTELGKNFLRYSLLQKSNGSWWIAVYRTNEIYNAQLNVITHPVTEKMTLNLEDKASEINLYVPNKSIEKQKTFNNQSSIEFDLISELVLIEIKI